MSEKETQEVSQPTQYRLVVRSAAEAVALVKERFGAEARVLAVRQLEAGGLARFLQKPRLEVIVEVGGPALPPPAEAGADASPQAAGDPESEAGEARGGEARADGAEEPTEKLTLSADAERARQREVGPEEPRAEAMAPRTRGREARSMSLLRAAGLDEAILARVQEEVKDFDWATASAPEVMSRLAAWLRRQYNAAPKCGLGRRRVFLGSCGAGKTTALCKTLAAEVFVRGARPAVLKLDGTHPNATDGLAAFCDVLDTPLLRSAAEVEEFGDETLLVIDVPGVGLQARGDQRELAQTLDALRVDTRILVVNAACETEVIADAYEMGRVCGATHVIFTHLDEVRRPGKLWRFALFGGLTPMAVCSGPSPADELEEDVFAALLARSFPANLAREVQQEGGEA
ncbi:MAG: hypothetical protein D6781_03715 [Verrucomicrobia bacterium]|nr:MAG: hypothetical protein D6781_03715 [Verrucomicrobiota bacterium]